MTLQEKYYGINTALNKYLKAAGIRCPVIKFGVDPATLKHSAKDQTNYRYPYIQTFIGNVRQQSWTDKESGIYTKFELQASYFTSPEIEFQNDSSLFRPYNFMKAAFSDVNLGVFLLTDSNTGKKVRIANVLGIREESDFSMVSGAPVPKMVLLVEMASMCSYPEGLPTSTGISTNDLGGVIDTNFL